jgi:hypothetical protein
VLVCSRPEHGALCRTPHQGDSEADASHNPPELAGLADRNLKGLSAELISGDVMWGSTQLRVSFSVGLSGLFRYAVRKSVPSLVTTISSPMSST